MTFALLIFSAFAREAGAQTDSLHLHLDGTTFVSRRHSSAIKADRDNFISIDMKSIQELPQIMGSTDPVNFIRNLPGVQTSSEYDSGVHIQGCDNAHNDINIAGVPIFGANHLFGFFSVFNPCHYTVIDFSHNSSANRLGGTLGMELPDTLKKPFTGEVSVGMMSSQGSVGVRTGERSHLRVSARQSYMNWLYKRWMHISGSPINYGFGDYNVTWQYATSDDRLWFDFYYGNDAADISEHTFNIGLGINWSNAVAALHYEHKGREVLQRHTLFYSGHHSNGLMTQDESSLDLISFLNTYGYKGKAEWKDLEAGVDVNFYDVQPQFPQTSGLYGVAENVGAERQRGAEFSLSGKYDRTSDAWRLTAGLKANLYINPESNVHWGLSPEVSASYNAYNFGQITASYSYRQQYLFQTGLSNIGLPVEFWYLAGKHGLPQSSHNADLAYKASIFRDALAISAGLYYKQLYNQAEYKGDMFDFFNSAYDLDKHLLKGRGWNYGINLMIHKQTGALTGWISYSLGRALRQFDHPDYTGIYPANHERIHEMNAVCSYRLHKWIFSGTFVYAGGAPFTAPEYYYLASGQVITQFGEHNACRMRPYIRADVSVTYTIMKNSRQENGINVSVYNVTGRENDVMYRLQYDEGKYRYGSMSFFLRFVPSISYYHKF